MIATERLVAPRAHLGVLVEPPAPQLLRALRAADARAGPRLLDTACGVLRERLQRRLGLCPPVVLAGHQAEFFHAGVLAKTVAAHALANAVGGTAVFLTVDSDQPKTAQLPVPQVTPGGLRRITVAIPGLDPRLPFELQPPTPREHWLQFFTQVATLLPHYRESLLRPLAEAWLRGADPLTYCDAWDRGRIAAEQVLGLAGVRTLRVSALAATPEFRRFAAALILDSAAVAAHYNAAQAAYRARHRVRTPGRPVPPLLVDGALREVPLWVVQPGLGRRRLFVRERGDTLELWADRTPLAQVARGALASSAAHEAPWPLAAEGWGLRPRALTLSGGVRLLLADLLIHGIGGARYDELTDDFLRRWLGAPPPPPACVSATLLLPLPHASPGVAALRAARHASRDLRWNPQRHLTGLPEELVRQRLELARRSDELRRHEPHDHETRRLVYQALHRLNETLLAHDPWRAAEYDQRVAELERAVEQDRIAGDREYFYGLHPTTAVTELVARIRAALEPVAE